MRINHTRSHLVSIKKPLSTVLCVILCIIFALLPLAAQTAETTEENVPTDTLPAVTEEFVDYTEEFLNANIYLFCAAVAVLLICTVAMIIIKVKKRNK